MSIKSIVNWRKASSDETEKRFGESGTVPTMISELERKVVEEYVE